MKKILSYFLASGSLFFGDVCCAAGALTDESASFSEAVGCDMLLHNLLENESGSAAVSVAPETMLSLSSLLGFFTDETKVVKNLGKSKVKEINLVVDFKHGSFKEAVEAVIDLFESFKEQSVSSCWELILSPINFENLAHSELAPLMHAIMGSVFASHLNIKFLTPDNPYEVYVLTKLREAFLTEESKVKTLDLEGSILSDKGWEQVALLAESGKPFYKMRLTGMKILSEVVPRLGAL